VQQKCAPLVAVKFFICCLEFVDRNFFQFQKSNSKNPKIPKIQIYKIFGKVIIWHIVGYTVIKLVERLTVVLSWRHIMHISFYALAPLVVFAAVGVLIILDRIREDINMRWHGHCRKLFEFGFDQAKIGNEKYSYSRSHRDLL